MMLFVRRSRLLERRPHINHNLRTINVRASSYKSDSARIDFCAAASLRPCDSEHAIDHLSCGARAPYRRRFVRLSCSLSWRPLRSASAAFDCAAVTWPTTLTAIATAAATFGWTSDSKSAGNSSAEFTFTFALARKRCESNVARGVGLAQLSQLRASSVQIGPDRSDPIRSDRMTNGPIRVGRRKWASQRRSIGSDRIGLAGACVGVGVRFGADFDFCEQVSERTTDK